MEEELQKYIDLTGNNNYNNPIIGSGNNFSNNQTALENANNQKIMQGDLGGRPSESNNILGGIVGALYNSYNNVKDSINKQNSSVVNTNNQQVYNSLNPLITNQQNNGVLSNIQQPISNVYGSKEFSDMQKLYSSQNANIQNEYLKQSLGQQSKESNVSDFFKNMQNEYYSNKEEIKNLLDPINNQTLDDMIRNTAKIKMLSGANKQLLSGTLDYQKGVGSLAQQNAAKFNQGRIGNMEDVSKDIFGKNLAAFSNDNKENFNLQESLYKLKLANDLKKQEEIQDETNKVNLARFINAGPEFINSEFGKKMLESNPSLARGFELYNLQQKENEKLIRQKASVEAAKTLKEEKMAELRHRYDVALEGVKNKNRIEQQKMKNADYNTEGDSAKQITG